jgi:hypothetical protein
MAGPHAKKATGRLGWISDSLQGERNLIRSLWPYKY